MVNPAASARSTAVPDAGPGPAPTPPPQGGPAAPPPRGDVDTFERTSGPRQAAPRDPYVYGPSYEMVKAGNGPGWAKGLRGPGVEKVQGLLRGAGYQVPPNGGRFDATTDAAVRKFQQDQKLPINGRVDKETLDALEAAQPGAAKPAQGADNASSSGAGGAEGAAAPPPTRPMTVADENRRWTSIYNNCTGALENGSLRKGQDPAKDQLVQDVIANSPSPRIFANPDANDTSYRDMISAQAAFFTAAKKAGYIAQQ
jgi:peptidoglycan hydrolase-like protein with peptidoglycan-binding domain